MSHWDESWYYKTPEQEERERKAQEAANKFDKDTHTTARQVYISSKLDVRVCTDCHALTFDPEEHRNWHKKTGK